MTHCDFSAHPPLFLFVALQCCDSWLDSAPAFCPPSHSSLVRSSLRASLTHSLSLTPRHGHSRSRLVVGCVRGQPGCGSRLRDGGACHQRAECLRRQRQWTQRRAPAALLPGPRSHTLSTSAPPRLSGRLSGIPLQDDSTRRNVSSSAGNTLAHSTRPMRAHGATCSTPLLVCLLSSAVGCFHRRRRCVVSAVSPTFRRW